jgi:cytochrome c oxidase subunit II
MIRTLVVLAIVGTVFAAGMAVAQQSAVVDSGRQVFMKNGCHGCHTVGAMGTPIGPDLSKVGTRYDADYFVVWLRDPAQQRPRAHMPKLELTEEDIRTLAAYLASLK